MHLHLGPHARRVCLSAEYGCGALGEGGGGDAGALAGEGGGDTREAPVEAGGGDSFGVGEYGFACGQGAGDVAFEPLDVDEVDSGEELVARAVVCMYAVRSGVGVP
ncbi:hypothetical protein [Streptomyces sp. NBC_01565]|uniref:hypothetical protein n=1 Tax=unclassified Streptomyces TaxID=2593676 RepID=UPI00225C2DCD|nr:hypothetical protein [Streptomyces sp. NBC_01565]MCX4546630.1 hypothetical protein [Streptomyces sp. NBC_01565]